ncbi:DUF4148 domain-containing protein [Paraburkholderia bonniea]|uniref:DUF4148 domain-containing protein n=1 Tax=Paraburkholderia bonniea TaxID=2152891 RepID=UPI001291783D|nr:DUF4148 domain-containing protein [Paraburkholderia bonniea]WJF92147.1 DUF4148 domain-containing protein [Paraburkholderia bonniea]WJF95467.1 DUF4148 domain-containing protein [Paraburkholderia bonniea]
MKALLHAVVVATVLATPLAALAQTNQPLTREQVRAELVQLQKAGYNPAGSHDNTTYPAQLQAASQRIQSSGQMQANADTSGYGAPVSGTSQSGMATTTVAPEHGIYFGH